MGYYTYFKMNIYTEDGEGLLDAESNLYSEVRNKFAEIFTANFPQKIDGVIEEAKNFFDTINEDGDEAKWYDCDENMSALAKAFPHLQFELEGYGEEREDWWVAQFWGDKTNKSFAEIIPPSPDLF
jgi:hypothetical protein